MLGPLYVYEMLNMGATLNEPNHDLSGPDTYCTAQYKHGCIRKM